MVMKAEHQRTGAFKLWCWRRLLRVPWTTKRSNQSILKKISPEYSLELLMLKLKLCINTLAIWCNELTHWKRPWCWERLKVGGEGDERGWDSWHDRWHGDMVTWHHQLDGHELEQAPGIGDGQGSLICCSWWDLKEPDITEQLNSIIIKFYTTCRAYRTLQSTGINHLAVLYSICKLLYIIGVITNQILIHLKEKLKLFHNDNIM